MDVNRVLDILQKLINRVEQELGCIIVVDVKVFDECLERAMIGFNKTKVDDSATPIDFKKAGQYAFWIRKLKPFRIWRPSEIIEQIDQIGGTCDHNYTCITKLAKDRALTPPDRPVYRYVNELIAVWIALAFMIGTSKSRDICLTKIYLQDLLARLRYDAWTPENLSLLFEAMAQQKR